GRPSRSTVTNAFSSYKRSTSTEPAAILTSKKIGEERIPTGTAAPATPERKKALGRGLASLLPGGSKPAPMTNLPSPAQTGAAAAAALKLNADGQGWRELDLNLVDKNPYQTRGYLDEAAMEELVASVQASGVVQPIVVRPAGEGRYQL